MLLAARLLQGELLGLGISVRGEGLEGSCMQEAGE